MTQFGPIGSGWTQSGPLFNESFDYLASPDRFIGCQLICVGSVSVSSLKVGDIGFTAK